MHLNNDLLDEELVLLHRYGKEDCGMALLHRYLKYRHSVGHRAAPALMGILDEESYTFVYNYAFVKALTSFRLGKKSFVAYFESILAHELHREVDSQLHHDYSSLLTLSMEMETHYEGTNGNCLHDIVGEEEDYDEVANFLRYAKALLKAGKFPDNISPKALAIFEKMNEGYSIRESCKILKIPYSSGKIMMRRLKDFIQTTYFHEEIVY